MDPRCPLFGACGGCASQDVPYPEQVERKRKILAEAVGFPDVEVFSGEPWAYRNRMDFVFHPGGLGLRARRRWWQIVDVPECPIAEPAVNALLREVRDRFADADVFDLRRKTGTFRYAVARATREETSLSFVLNSESPRLGEAMDRVRTYAPSSRATHVVAAPVPPNSDRSVADRCEVLKGTDRLTERLFGRTFRFPIQGFFQNNRAMAERMLAYVRGLLEGRPTREGCLLDLYSGVGTFGVTLGDLFGETVLVESVAPAIEAAKENLALNGLPNARAVALDARDLGKVPLGTPLAVVTDPPRAGMHPRTLERLNVLDPEILLYVSCNVSRLAEEVRQFPRHRIERAALFDLFPQTPHLEAIVSLRRR
jgi:23S rRNA (uracil-5-)-methyltransferase RumA